MKVVLLPMPAFGHMIPFLQLAQALAKAGIQVHYVATPRNIKRLRKLTPNLSPFFHFVELPMPVLQENPLPQGAESTADIGEDKYCDLIKTYDLLKQPCKEFLMDNKPDWLIIDIIQHWASDIAHECNLPVMLFLIFTAAASVFYGSLINGNHDNTNTAGFGLEDLTSPPDCVTFPSKVAFRHFEAVDILDHSSPINLWSLSANTYIRLARIFDKSEAVVIRSWRGIDGEYLDLFTKPVIPVALLPPSKPEITTTQSDHQDETSWDKIFHWLDEQKPKSVFYAAFGSNSYLTTAQILEIAHGLEESEQPFLLVLSNDISCSGVLPLLREFLDRTTVNQGRVCFGWAPQWDILAHPGIGGFFSHAGWSSVIEGLLHGHSLVLFPHLTDQYLNSRFLVEKGLAIEVERNEEDGTFRRKDIAKCLKQAMGEGEEGQRLRARTKEASAIVGDRKLRDQSIDELVKFLHEKATINPK